VRRCAVRWVRLTRAACGQNLLGRGPDSEARAEILRHVPRKILRQVGAESDSSESSVRISTSDWMVVYGRYLGMTMLEVGLGGGIMLVLNLLRPSFRGRRTAPASGTNVGGVSPGRVKAWHKVVFQVVPRYGKGRPVWAWEGPSFILTWRIQADLFWPRGVRGILLARAEVHCPSYVLPT
jgi:hypothetical protein